MPVSNYTVNNEVQLAFVKIKINYVGIIGRLYDSYYFYLHIELNKSADHSDTEQNSVFVCWTFFID